MACQDLSLSKDQSGLMKDRCVAAYGQITRFAIQNGRSLMMDGHAWKVFDRLLKVLL